VDLRLAGENLLGARDRSTRLAVAAGDSWMLAGRDGGDRTWLLTVEGKW
jgi:iron complex outermembrane receptor protein